MKNIEYIMIEKSIYDNYEIDFSMDYDSDYAYYFIFNENRELCLTDKKELLSDISNLKTEYKIYFGRFKQKDCFIVKATSKGKFYDLRDIYEFNKELYQIASKAVLVNDWYLSHRYCGRCGSKNVIDDKDMMMRCPECNQLHYPRIAPAIIVAITKESKLLMAKHSYHKTDMYALIAGFVEPGESIEEAVKREIKEEIGITVKNIKYIKSQSWPFPNSLMLGFTAEYESGEIRVDGDEIVDAKWFSAEEIIKYPSDISISAWLIENFINKNKR